jgi:hypothetical protein
MKKIAFFLFTIALMLLMACNYSKGVKKDLTTGLSASYNGFGIDDIYLTDADGNRLNNHTIVMGTKIAIVATGVDHFVTKEGKAFPGCRIVLTDKNKKEVLNLPDAFSDMVNGTTEAESKTLQASLNTGNPMLVGETYHLSVRFFDKHKAENEIVADVDILMKE